ncbi:MAG: hypothetical protein HY675_00525 [Chloroflexi bacterium]|nr:hypothetical protein [Chloroflexota bacterium]
MVMTLPYGAKETRNIGQSRQMGVDGFVATGIDDLAKYRVVQLLCGRPDTCWNAAKYAERLGLRPIERTAAELDELVERHVLEKQGDGGEPQYKLTSDGKLRSKLSRLFSMAQAALRNDRVLARLAFRSLERAKREAKKNKSASPVQTRYDEGESNRGCAKRDQSGHRRLCGTREHALAPHGLPLDELECTAMPQVMRKMEGRFTDL